MCERVSAVLLLYRHVALQGLQHALRLQEDKDGMEDRLCEMAVKKPTRWACLNLWTHLRWVRLHRGQIVLQGQAAVVVEDGLHPDQMGLHQPLPLSGHLLLQCLQHGLEVLVEEGRDQDQSGSVFTHSRTPG